MKPEIYKSTEWWYPIKGQWIHGIYKGYDIEENDYGKQKIHYMENADHFYQFYGSYQLDKVLEQLGTDIYIGIEYTGRKRTKNKRWMKSYKFYDLIPKC